MSLKRVETVIEDIEDKVLEKIWTSENVAYCLHALQQLKYRIEDLQKTNRKIKNSRE